MDLTVQTAFQTKDANSCPLFRYTGATVLVRGEEGLAEALDAAKGEKVLGFDTETRPVFRKGEQRLPALLQLALADCVYLIQLRLAPLNKRLLALLSDPGVVKAGVAIADDMRSLRLLHDFEPAGLVDLGEVARRNNLGVHSLRGLAASLLGVRVSKAERCSNWEASELRDRQIIYAATDAWISRQLYLRALCLGLTLNP